MKIYKNIERFNDLIIQYYNMKVNSCDNLIRYGININKSVFEINENMFEYVNMQKEIAKEIYIIIQKIPKKYRKSLKLYCMYLNSRINYNQMIKYGGISIGVFRRRLVLINKRIGK